MKKAFDIEKAKAGAKVVTRNGNKVRILCYDNTDIRYPIVAVVYDKDSNSIYDYTAYTANGKYMNDSVDNDYDLLIEEEPTYRPYANEKEMDEAIKGHGMFVKNLYGRRLAITGYDDERAAVGNGPTTRYGTMLRCYTWIDGTPCGMQEGGTK